MDLSRTMLAGDKPRDTPRDTASDLVMDFPWRRRLVLGFLAAGAAALMWRSVDLQVHDTEFLQREGRARYLRTVTVHADRGAIHDRNGVVLAASTPIDSVWVNPRELDIDGIAWIGLVRMLGLDAVRVREMIESRRTREFVYLKRHVPPELAGRVRAIAPEGVYLQREYRRYYPAADLTGHLLGFTDVDDRGQEGIELAYDAVLQSTPGREQVLRDRKGHVVGAVQSLQAPRPGDDLYLSIDRRVQYFAFRALASAVKRHKARAASAVVLDARTGEVLAMVNQPSFNPNRRTDRISEHYRNRAVTDLFEPGSTIKPFTVAAALMSGHARLDTVIDTAPGTLRVAGHTVRDARNYGAIDLETLVAKSSNVGAVKLALAVDAGDLWQVLSRAGFGVGTGSGFPGEADGVMTHFFEWRDIHRATLSFGYGLSVSALQLARAYGAIANDGVMREVTLLRRTGDAPGQEVMPAAVARQLRRMLEAVTNPGGTGTRAAVHGYRVAGKTGTVRKPEPGGYSKDRYLSLFTGMLPMSAPSLVIVVIIDEPRGDRYYGGDVAAPVFAEIAAGAVRVLGLAPDDPDAPASPQQRIAQAADATAEALR